MKRLIVLALCGCGGAVPDGTTGGQMGYGMPTLEVTVNGVHAGPAAPDSGSFVDLVNQYDSTGALKRSSLQIVAASSAAGASCFVAADRYGEFVTSFGVGQYTLSGSGTSGTSGAEAVPVGAPTVATQQGSFSCTGSACGAVGVQLSWIDATHAEGFVSGPLSGASVVCSFYLPTRTFRP